MGDWFHDQKEEQDARTALLRYYSSECIAHGIYILTIVIALFTFLRFFPFVEFPVGELKAFTLALVLDGFVTISICVVGRAFFWGYLARTMLFVKPLNYEDTAEHLKRHEGKVSNTYLMRLHFAVIHFVNYTHKRLSWFWRIHLSELLVLYFLLLPLLFVLIFLS